MAKAVSDENLAEFKAYADEEYAHKSALRFVTIPEGARLTRAANEHILRGLTNGEQEDIYAQIFGHAPDYTPEGCKRDILSLAGVSVVLNPFTYTDAENGATIECGWGFACLGLDYFCAMRFCSPDTRAVAGVSASLTLTFMRL